MSKSRFIKNDDGFHPVTISWLNCMHAIYNDSMYSNQKKACNFEGISEQMATVSFEYVGGLHD